VTGGGEGYRSFIDVGRIETRIAVSDGAAGVFTRIFPSTSDAAVTVTVLVSRMLPIAPIFSSLC
jgi:hypothetical protein